MKIAFVSPRLPPEHCGVGDYCARLALEISRKGHRTAIWTATRFHDPIEGVEVFAHEKILGMPPLLAWAKGIHEWKPDALVIQFTPYLYGPGLWGLNPAFVPWLASLRAREKAVTVFAHELHYPIGLDAKGILIGLPQWMQFAATLKIASSALFSCDVMLEIASKLAPGQRSHMDWVSIGAAVEPRPNAQPADFAPERRLLLHFGTAHASRQFDHCFAALDEAARAGHDVTLAFVGMSDADVKKKLEDARRQDLSSKIIALGYLPSADASRWMLRADAILAPLIDGVSTRRSSVSAALAHSKPVVTTIGYSSGSAIPWTEFTAAAQAHDIAAFAQLATRVLGDSAYAAALSRSAAQASLRYFGWQMITEKVLSLVNSDANRLK